MGDLGGGWRIEEKGKQTVEKAEERGSCNQSSNKRHFPRERRPALNRKRHYRSTPAASSIILTKLIYVCLFLVVKLKNKKQKGGRGGRATPVIYFTTKSCIDCEKRSC